MKFIRIINFLAVVLFLSYSYASGADKVDNIRKEYVNVKFSIPSFGSKITVSDLKINSCSIPIPAAGQTETGWIELTGTTSDSLSLGYKYTFLNFNGCLKTAVVGGMGGIIIGDPPVPDPADPQVDYYWNVEFYVSYTFTNVASSKYNIGIYKTLEKRLVK